MDLFEQNIVIIYIVHIIWALMQYVLYAICLYCNFVIYLSCHTVFCHYYGTYIYIYASHSTNIDAYIHWLEGVSFSAWQGISGRPGRSAHSASCAPTHVQAGAPRPPLSSETGKINVAIFNIEWHY